MTKGVVAGAMALAVVITAAHTVPAATGDEALEVRLQVADLLFAESRYEEAAVLYERLLEATTGRQQARAATGLITSLLRRAEFQSARARAEDLISGGVPDGTLLALHGDALWASGLFSAAEHRYREALDLNGAEPRGLNGLARVLAAKGRLDEAHAAAAAATAVDPREPDFHHTLGFVLERQRRFAEAAAAFTNFINLLPRGEDHDRAVWTRERVRLLESFGRRRPFAIRGGEEAVHELPFRVERDKIVIQGSINGGRPVDFVVDTGAEMTVVSREVARNRRVEPLVSMLSAGVGQAGIRGLEIGRADRLRFGTLEVANVPVLIKNPPLLDLPTREAESVSPLAFGLSMRIDYARGVLTLGRELPDALDGVRLPLWQHRLTFVQGEMNNDTSAPFVVDTGGEVISLSRATAQALDVRPPRHIPLKVFGMSGWDPDAFLLPGIDLAFGSVRLENFAVVVLNLDAPSALLGFELGGTIGHRFLSRYVVDIDLVRSELRLAPVE